jgi:outer membrane protein
MSGAPRRGATWLTALLSLQVASLLLVIATARGEDLLALYQLAVQNDPTLAGERYNLEATEQRIPEARSALLPAISGNGQVGRTGGPVTYTDTPTVDRTFDTLNWTVQLSIPLLSASSIANYKESHAQVAQAEKQLSLAEQDLLVRLTQAYFDVVVATESVEAADAELKATEEQRALAQASYAKGVVSVTDVDEATSRAELATSQEVAAEAQVQVVRAALERITGSSPATLAAMRADVVLHAPDPPDVSQWVAQAKDNNLAVLALRSAVEVAHLEVEKATMARLPSINAMASYGRDFSSGNDTNPVDFATNARIKQGGIELTLPLIDGGAMHAQVAEARARERKAEADLEGARRQAALDAQTAYQAVVSGIAQIRSLRAAINASINSVKGNIAGYKAGLRINSDVLDAQRERYAAERDLAKARYDTVLQGIKLKAAAGTLRGFDLSAVNAMLAADDALR